ncbi:hypothetical protein BDF19DRAFT_420435 [Syncephalis fuscata]|nr:hypothetical protein BDF19DRAFT_420435 [Syncephalis fuscata]
MSPGEYIYERVAGGKPKPLESDIYKNNKEFAAAVGRVCVELEKVITERATLTKLSASPGDFVPAYAHNENYYENNTRNFYDVFNFENWATKEELLNSSEQRRIKFMNSITTDGYSVDFHFYRESRKSNCNNVELSVADFRSEDIAQYFRPCAVDPGISQVFTAAYGHGNEFHKSDDVQQKNITTIPALSAVYENKMDKKTWKKLKKLKLSYQRVKHKVYYNTDNIFPMSFSTWPNCLTFTIPAHQTTFSWLSRSAASSRRNGNILTNGGKKYSRKKRKEARKKRQKRGRTGKNHRKRHGKKKKDDPPIVTITKVAESEPPRVKEGWRPARLQTTSKMPLVVFGDAMFGKQNNVYKGYRFAVVNKCWQMLKRRKRRGNLVAIKIDEYLSFR